MVFASEHWTPTVIVPQQYSTQPASVFMPAQDVLADNRLPNLDHSQLVSCSHHASGYPMTAAAAAAAFGSAVGLDMLVEPSAVAGLPGLGSNVCSPMEDDDDEDGPDYINLLDGTAPEGLYHVTLARAEAAIPLEATNSSEATKRCVQVSATSKCASHGSIACVHCVLMHSKPLPLQVKPPRCQVQ